MFTQTRVSNIPHLSPGGLFCFSKVGSDGTVDKKDQRAKVPAISAFPPSTLSCSSFPARSVQSWRGSSSCRLNADAAFEMKKVQRSVLYSPCRRVWTPHQT